MSSEPWPIHNEVTRRRKEATNARKSSMNAEPGIRSAEQRYHQDFTAKNVMTQTVNHDVFTDTLAVTLRLTGH